MKRLLKMLDVPILLLFTLSVALTAVGGAAAVKLGFPAATILMALVWSATDPARYLRLVLWSVMMAPGLRHYVDYHAGFSQQNPIMLSPYLEILAATPTVALYVLNGRRYAVEFTALFVPIVIATAIAIGVGDAIGALMAAMRWLTPLWLALYVCARADQVADMRDSVVRTFRWALPIIAIYGIVQFANILPWDVYFMKEAPIDSIGVPKPFQVRVFATMNVPGSLATMLSTSMLLLLPTVRGARWVSILLGAATLMLTTQRAAMGAFVCAIFIMAALSGDRMLRRGVVKLVVVVAVVCVVLLAIPGAAHKLTATAASVSQISQNESAQERLRQYEDLLPVIGSDIFGRGLGWSGNSLYTTVGTSTPLDSGLIDIGMGLGVIGGTLFLVALGILTARARVICLRFKGAPAASEFAAIAYGLLQLPFGSQHTQEGGIFMFLAMGLLLARAAPRNLSNACVVASRPSARIPFFDPAGRSGHA